MNRLVAVLIVVPLAIVLVALGVANRGPVALTFDPFNPGSPGLTVEMPLFVLIFGATAIGLVIGSLVTWLKQGRYRRQARDSASASPTGSALTRPRA
jgi:uncharacterized integral membrane protein